MNFKNIPRELTELNQWVNTWNNSKIPMKTTEKKAASSTNPDTWGTFEQASYNVEQGFYDYLGFVFSGNGYVGIDIDLGYEDGLLTDLAVDLITTCGSYTERSRSGRGVHIILKGDIPFKGKNNNEGVEMYKEGRYFITTGDVVKYDTIIENQIALDYVCEKYFKDTQMEFGNCSSRGNSNEPYVPRDRIYNIQYNVTNTNIVINYPPIPQGCRNTSLLSLGGQLMNAGYTDRQIFQELLKANKAACNPPLEEREIENIVRSVLKYRR